MTKEELHEFGGAVTLVLAIVAVAGIGAGAWAYYETGRPIFSSAITLFLAAGVFFSFAGKPRFLKDWLSRR